MKGKLAKGKVTKWCVGGILAIILIALLVFLFIYTWNVAYSTGYGDSGLKWLDRQLQWDKQYNELNDEKLQLEILYNELNHENSGYKCRELWGGQTIVKYTGNEAEIIIPAVWDDRTVTSIGDHAFRWCDSATSIHLPDSITSIGECAFWCCENLEEIYINPNVTSIGSGAFAGCSSLESFQIPYGVTSIEAAVFGDCISLSSVTIPDSVTSIGVEAFWGCPSLTVLIPDSVTFIGEDAFGGYDGEPSPFIYVHSGSYAEQYCIDNNLPYTLADN